MSDVCTCHPLEANRHLIVGHPGTIPFGVPWDFTDDPRPDAPWEIPQGPCTVEGCEGVSAVYNWDFASWSWPQVCSAHADPICKGCGTAPDDPAMGGTSGCQYCLPETCSTCGGVNHIATDRMCSCWVSIEDISLADQKAIFAGDGTFNVNGNGELTVA